MRRSGIILIALLAAVSLAVGCSRSSTPSDDELAKEVKSRLFSAELESSKIDVAVKDGEVTLSGEATSEAARYAAYKAAVETPGIRKVNDQMIVQVAEAEPEPELEPAPAPVRRTTPRPSPAPVPQPMTQAVPQPAPQPVAVPATSVPRTREMEIPAGMTLVIRMIDSIDSEQDQTGEVFQASLDAPIVIDDEVVVPAGQDVFVRLVDARSAGRMTGRSELRLELVRLVYQGKSYTLDSTTYEEVGASRGKRSAATIGGGAAIGAAIGAIAGGGKGAAIGAAVGAGSGTAVQVLTKGEQVRIPSETRLEFRLEQPVTINYTPRR